MRMTDGALTRERVVHLNVGDPFPTVTARRVGGGEMVLPRDVEADWAVILLYRGHWCPYCRQQLVDFQQNLHRFRAADVRLVALSADAEADAQETVRKHGIQFAVGYGLDPSHAGQALGTYLPKNGGFVQATGFVLRPGGRVELAVYSSGAVGRLVARDVLGLIDYARKQE